MIGVWILRLARIRRGTLAAGRDFEVDFKNVASLRNDVDHVKNIVRSDADLKEFAQRLETAETWLQILQNPASLATSAG